jgi:hypothetical protein
MFNDFATLGYVHFIAAVVAGKWAMELGFRQVRQSLWMIAAFVFPPLVLLALYVRLVRRQQAEHKPAGAWW